MTLGELLADRPIETITFVSALLGFGGGVFVERIRAKVDRAERRKWWQARNAKWRNKGAAANDKGSWAQASGGANGGTGGAGAAGGIGDSADQLRIVMNASYELQPLLNKSERRVFDAAEKAIADERLDWRVMAQVSLGEVLRSKDAAAYAAVNSKRVDLLIVTHEGRAVAAIEYQGGGHYQSTAAARDAVKKEALRRAGVPTIEVVGGTHGPEDLRRELRRLASGTLAAGKQLA